MIFIIGFIIIVCIVIIVLLKWVIRMCVDEWEEEFGFD